MNQGLTSILERSIPMGTGAFEGRRLREFGRQSSLTVGGQGPREGDPRAHIDCFWIIVQCAG